MIKNKPYILIIDDNEDAREILRRIVTQIGYRVRLAETGDLALKIVEEELPVLILLDLMMPGINGYQFLNRLKEYPQMPYIPVIIISSITSSLPVPSQDLSNVIGVFQKANISIPDLTEMLRELIAEIVSD